MGFFDFLKKSAAPAAPAAPAFPLVLAADAKGAVVPMEQIPEYRNYFNCRCYFVGGLY